MATNRIEDRISHAFGLCLSPAVPEFENSQSVPYGGVMLLLPFLLSSGLMSYKSHYTEREGYYSFSTLLITLSFIILLRIKSIEQIKLYNPGEMGKLVGTDRIPEIKTIRSIIRELTAQKKCSDWSKDLSIKWTESETPELYYIDGHVQVYHGYLAELGKKHVSRQRLCLPGMMEFWVNGKDGMPFFFITATVNEKMIEMLDNEIIPQLLKIHYLTDEHREKMQEQPDYPRFTLAFDREGYSPAFFKRLWDEHRIAVLTYRKNVKKDDIWDQTEFQEMEVETHFGKTKMKLHEKTTTVSKYSMREIRRLSPDGHQTSIITTNKILTLVAVAAAMFGRWIQENFFRYFRQEYSFDKIIQYTVDEIDNNVTVVNREYSNITSVIKKKREQLSRRKADLYDHQLKTPSHDKNEPLSKEMGVWIAKQFEIKENIRIFESEIEILIEKRKSIPYKISIGQMPVNDKYVKLNQESKYLMNIIKMICYRAETALANLLAKHFSRADDEVRALVKAIIAQPADFVPDYCNNTLTVTIYPLTNLRAQNALANILDIVNDNNYIYPESNLTLFFKIATSDPVPIQEF
jgi:hypothetical protein